MRSMATTFIFAGCILSPHYGMTAERAVDLELVLAVDISRSMDPEEAALVRQGFAHAVRHPEVIDAIRRGSCGRIAVTYVEWGHHQYQRTRVDWVEISDASSAAAFAEAVAQSSVILVKWTSISGAIAFGAKRFRNNGFRSERRIIDITGDGPNNNGPYVDAARDRAVADGIVINGLPIINNRPQVYGYPPFPDLDLYYEDCVIGGLGSFMVVADGFKDFARAVLRKLVTEVAGRSPSQSLILPVAARSRPPCNAGEIQLQKFLEDQTWEPPTRCTIFDIIQQAWMKEFGSKCLSWLISGQRPEAQTRPAFRAKTDVIPKDMDAVGRPASA